ncbi:glycosyl transferase [Acidovorax sp. HMWF029]|uniref:glycosyltransferase n=1 Tax=Acidovorax sp. HMWF029 TaxID=2056863 RepID=UPI000D33312F|nr:glycosyltransferase [Acidovorax sp. HMWF029]PTT19010.1 glycosyl transferase [Acidovorax sp. HMWF029]
MHSLDQTPRVLVLLAAFNGMAFLPAQITSVLDQQAVAVQVVISIDRSCDGTEAWAEQLAQQNPRVSVLQRGQVFGGAAPNFFRLLRDVDMTRCDYVALADQDDLWHTDKLAHACQQLRFTGAAGYSGNVTAFWPGGKERLIDKAQPQQPWDFLFEGPGPGCTFVLAQPLALALQTWVRQQGQALQPVDFHDWLIYAWVRAQGYQWLIDAQPHLRYRQHAHNQLGANAGLRPLLHRAWQMGNGWWLGQASLIARLLQLHEHPFVAPWLQGQRGGLLQLAMRAGQCRRRQRDQLLFFLSCLWMVIFLPGRGRLPCALA